MLYIMITISTFFDENNLNFVISVQLCSLLNIVNKHPVLL